MQSNYFMIFLDFDLANMEGAGDYGAGFGAQDQHGNEGENNIDDLDEEEDVE